LEDEDNTRTVAIATGVSIPIVVLAAGFGLFFFYRRRNNKRKLSQAETIVEVPKVELKEDTRYEAGSEGQLMELAAPEEVISHELGSDDVPKRV
jgi:hypothetical protein